MWYLFLKGCELKVPVELGSMILCQVLNFCSLTTAGRLLEGSCFSLTAPRNLWILSAWKDGRREEKGTTEDEMVGWHHWLSRHELEQAPGVGDGQGSLACCSPWGLKETQQRPNWTEHSWRVAVTKNGHKASGFLHVPLFLSFSVHSLLFNFGVGLISCTVIVQEHGSLIQWYTDVYQFLGGSFSSDRGLQFLQYAALCCSTVFFPLILWCILMSVYPLQTLNLSHIPNFFWIIRSWFSKFVNLFLLHNILHLHQFQEVTCQWYLVIFVFLSWPSSP